jgi:hypothetical protein
MLVLIGGKHGEENNILYPLQHGFRKGHSCETQLIEFVDGISKNLQEGQQTDIPILDFAKAFDKVNHSLLIHKLQNYGIIGKSVRWIQNNTGETFAMRPSSGTTPVSSDFWNISCSSGEISVASSFRILGDMLSGPGALYGFMLF